MYFVIMPWQVDHLKILPRLCPPMSLAAIEAKKVAAKKWRMKDLKWLLLLIMKVASPSTSPCTVLCGGKVKSLIESVILFYFDVLRVIYEIFEV